MIFPSLINSDLGLLILRLAVAFVFWPHGWGKLKNIKGMAQGMGMPAAAVLALGLVEVLSATGLIVGYCVQLAALLLAVVMVGAIGMKIMKWKVPFVASNQPGWELDLALLAANLAILFTGGGEISIF